jgi:hypothetical protein
MCADGQRAFASRPQPDIHLIGDAAIAGKMLESGVAAIVSEPNVPLCPILQPCSPFFAGFQPFLTET